MSLFDVVSEGRGASERERAKVPRGVRLRMALREVQATWVALLFAQPRGEHAADAVDMEFRIVDEQREMLRRNVFPEYGFDRYVVDGDYECEFCTGGHRHDCESRKMPNDLHDCMWKACKGCCPNGCPEYGIAREATRAGEKLRRMIVGGRDTPRYDVDSEVDGAVLVEDDLPY